MAVSESPHEAESTTVTPDAEELIFGEPLEWDETLANGGMERVGPLGPMDSGITPDTARQLIDGGHMSPEGTQNGSMTMEKLVSVAEELNTPDVEIEITGYVISPYRPDDRIRLTGITATPSDDDAELPSDIRDTFEEEFATVTTTYTAGSRSGDLPERSDLDDPFNLPQHGADDIELHDDLLFAYWD